MGKEEWRCNRSAASAELLFEGEDAFFGGIGAGGLDGAGLRFGLGGVDHKLAFRRNEPRIDPNVAQAALSRSKDPHETHSHVQG